MELEEESNFGNINNINNNDYYLDLLSKELLKYNLSNIFNILNDKKTIIQSSIFYFLKKNPGKWCVLSAFSRQCCSTFSSIWDLPMHQG